MPVADGAGARGRLLGTSASSVQEDGGEGEEVIDQGMGLAECVLRRNCWYIALRQRWLAICAHLAPVDHDIGILGAEQLQPAGDGLLKRAGRMTSGSAMAASTGPVVAAVVVRPAVPCARLLRHFGHNP